MKKLRKLIVSSVLLGILSSFYACSSRSIERDVLTTFIPGSDSALGLIAIYWAAGMLVLNVLYIIYDTITAPIRKQRAKEAAEEQKLKTFYDEIHNETIKKMKNEGIRSFKGRTDHN